MKANPDKIQAIAIGNKKNGDMKFNLDGKWNSVWKWGKAPGGDNRLSTEV